VYSNCSKFFGQPNGAAKPPPQQTKLSFATKAKPEKEEESEDEAPEVKQEVVEPKKIKKESDASAKENDEPDSGPGMCAHKTRGWWYITILTLLQRARSALEHQLPRPKRPKQLAQELSPQVTTLRMRLPPPRGHGDLARS
jgi:hypothetical protein